MATRIDVQKLLDELRITAKRSGRKLVTICPSPDHEDTSASWSIIDDPGSGRHGSHWCFSCGFGGGPWELVAAVRDLTIEESGTWCREHVQGQKQRAAEHEDVPRVRIVNPVARVTEMILPHGTRIPSLDGFDWNASALAYLEGRGIPRWQIDRWHIGFATTGRLKWRVVVPVYTGGKLLSFVARAFLNDGRIRYLAAERGDQGARPDAALFGEPGFDLNVRVATVTEGVFKALAMERAGAPNPNAVLGSQNLGPEKIASLSRFDGLLIATDPDRAGDIAFEQIADATCRYAEPVRVRLERSPDDASDEENASVWRTAMMEGADGIRRRRSARLRSRVAK